MIRHKLAVINYNTALGEPLEWLTEGKGHFKNIDAIDFPDDIKSRAWEIYRKAYSRITGPLLKNDEDDLLVYRRWVVIVDENSECVAIALLKEHDHGLKLGLTAADMDNTEARGVLVTFLRRIFNEPGVFGEVSPPLEMVLQGHVPVVEAEKAVRILGPEKGALSLEDGIHHKRTIGKIGEVEKKMVGRPVAPT